MLRIHDIADRRDTRSVSEHATFVILASARLTRMIFVKE